MDNTDTWWYEELGNIFIAPIGSPITADMKRAANIAMEVAQGKTYSEDTGVWEKKNA